MNIDKLLEITNKHNMSQIPSEALFIVNAAEKLNPHVIVEIGVWYGGNYKLLSSLLKDPTDIMVGIDIQKQKWTWNRKDLPCENHYIIGNSVDETTHDKLKYILKGREIDVLYIDGSHDYKYVKIDYDMYSPLVRDGGMIAFHDLNMCNVNDRSVKGIWEDLDHPRKFQFSDPKHKDDCYGVGYIIK